METFRDAAGEASDVHWLRDLVTEAYVAGLPLNSRSIHYETGRLVKSGPGLLFGFSVYNSNIAAQFIQVYDLDEAPQQGAAPEAVFTVATVQHLAVSYIFPGRFFRQGIWIGNSSTAPTYTAGGSDCYFDAQFA